MEGTSTARRQRRGVHTDSSVEQGPGAGRLAGAGALFGARTRTRATERGEDAIGHAAWGQPVGAEAPLRDLSEVPGTRTRSGWEGRKGNPTARPHGGDGGSVGRSRADRLRTDRRRGPHGPAVDERCGGFGLRGASRSLDTVGRGETNADGETLPRALAPCGTSGGAGGNARGGAGGTGPGASREARAGASLRGTPPRRPSVLERTIETGPRLRCSRYPARDPATEGGRTARGQRPQRCGTAADEGKPSKGVNARTGNRPAPDPPPGGDDAVRGNAVNPRSGTGLQHARNPWSEEAVGVVRNHEDGTRCRGWLPRPDGDGASVPAPGVDDRGRMAPGRKRRGT